MSSVSVSELIRYASREMNSEKWKIVMIMFLLATSGVQSNLVQGPQEIDFGAVLEFFTDEVVQVENQRFYVLNVKVQFSAQTVYQHTTEDLDQLPGNSCAQHPLVPDPRREIPDRWSRFSNLHLQCPDLHHLGSSAHDQEPGVR